VAPQTAKLVPVEVFYSYSHKDEKLRDKLDNHLTLLQRQGFITEWHDRQIEAGDDWETEINTHLNSAQIILLLVSDDFIASDYCYSVEMESALERHKSGEACVIPIILRPVDWESSPLGKLQALPKNAKPVTTWKNRDEAFKNAAQGIRKVIKEFKPKDKIVTTSTFIPRPPVVGFVARRDEQGRDIVERLKEELASQGSVLITLSGPGGIGKTTLAAEAARALKEAFGGRIVWSKADGRTDFSLSTLLDDIATQLGREDLRTLAPALKAAQVRELIADPPTLIVLDNYETIAADAKKDIAEWLALAQCSALFTSRHGNSWARNIPIAAMSREEAQEYLEKLVAETQDAQIFSDDVRRRIYETAEANPYVLQWVVAQIGAAQEPRTVLDELAHGEGDAATRVFDRSFNLEQVGDDGRAALLALSLFVPSATLSALAEVAGFSDDLKRVREAAKNLRALWLIKGIVENRRFTIEGLTRSLSHARLSKDDRADEFRKRFVAHFLNYAEAHVQRTREDFDALEAEKDNLLSAMDTAFERKDWASVIQTRFALDGFLDLRGHWDEAIRSGQQALAVARYSQNESSIASLAHNLAFMRQKRGELESARQLYDESLAIEKRLDNQGGIAMTLHELAAISQVQGEVEKARRLYNKSLKINKTLGNQSGIAMNLHNLAAISQVQGEVEKAHRLYNESLKINKTLDYESGIASTLHQLGKLAQEQGEVEEARRLYNESLEIKKRFGNQSGIASTLHQLAMLAQIQEEVEEARRLYDESLEIKRKLGNQSGIAVTLHQLGRLAEDKGEVEEARRLYNESLEIEKKLGNQSGIALSLHQLAILAHNQEDIEEARRLYKQSLEITKRLGNQSGIASTLHQLGRLAEDETDMVNAARLFREALVIFKRLKSPDAEIARESLERVEKEAS
jgi:tetratricopeptide (TPR) repeat protein